MQPTDLTLAAASPESIAVTVIRDRQVAAPREGRVRVGAAWAATLRDVLELEHSSDVHFAAYEPVEIPCEGAPGGYATVRLEREAVAEGLPIAMVALVGDVDDRVAHEQQIPARREWRQETEPKLNASGLAWYHTRGGARVLALLAEPFEIKSAADAAEWSARHAAWCESLREQHGLELDPLHDWQRIYRAPNVVRDGKRQRSPVRGTWRNAALPPATVLPLASAPLPTREPSAIVARAERVILEALGDWREYQGRKHALCGALGGALRKAGWQRDECAALIEAWLPANEPGVDVPQGVAWACGAWDRPAEIVSGESALRNLLPRDVANIVVNAATLPRTGLVVSPTHEIEVATDPSDAPIPGVTFADRARLPPPLRFLIEGLDLAPGKVSALQAFANVAKTPFALLMGLCVASGRDFLGCPVRQCPVLFLAFEGGLIVQEREARLCAGLGLNRAAVPFHLGFASEPFSPVVLERVEGFVRSRDVGLIVVDTYASALPPEVDHNSAQFSHWLRQLALLSDATDATILALLHESKSDKADGMRGISGHNSVPGAIQAAIRLTRRSEDKHVIHVECSRELYSAFRPFDIRFADVPDASAPRGSALVVERIAEAPVETRTPIAIAPRPTNAAGQRLVAIAGQRILDFLRASPTTQAAKELRSVSGEGTRVAERALARLCDAKLIERRGGHFLVTPEGREADDITIGNALGAVAGFQR